jgi:D-alanyl-D-alanine carboxypeptidase (penicillin-binding protein 5/6)
MKTGHTESAGYCLVTSAKRNDTRLISVVVGAPSETARATESQKLLNYGFQYYETTLVYKKGQPVKSLKVWKGHDDMLDATVSDDLYLTLPKGQYSQLKATVTSKQPLLAPINAGQPVGTIQFALNNKVVHQEQLVSAEKVEVAGLFGRLWDSIKLWFE